MVLKPVRRISLKEIVARAEETPDEQPPTMDEVGKIVHEVRRAYRVPGE